MVTASKSGPIAPASFDSALQELELLVARLESGDLPLEQLLTKFCRSRLEAVEQQVKLLDQGTHKPWTPE